MGEPWEPMLIAPPAAASSHLSDGELFTANTPGQVKHLADCAWCSYRQDAASAGTAAGADDDFEQAPRAGQWRDEFKHASQEAVLPDQVRALMTAPASVGDVSPGQIWRLTWRGRHLLVAVIEVADWQVLSAPVTTDVSLADELLLVVQAGQSPLSTDLAYGCVAARPSRSLFSTGHWEHCRALGVLISAQAALQQLTQAHLTGCAAPGYLPVGTHLSENDVDRLAMHDALREQSDWFAAAGAGLINSDGILTAAQEQPNEERRSAQPLSDLLRGSGLSLRQLAAHTGIDMGPLAGPAPARRDRKASN